MESRARRARSWVWLVFSTCIRLAIAVVLLVFGIRWWGLWAAAIVTSAYLAFTAPFIVIRIGFRCLTLTDGQRMHFVFSVYRTKLVVLLCLLVAALASRMVLLSILLATGSIVPLIMMLVRPPEE